MSLRGTDASAAPEARRGMIENAPVSLQEQEGVRSALTKMAGSRIVPTLLSVLLGKEPVGHYSDGLLEDLKSATDKGKLS
jgi:hypothetical protein